MITVHRPTMGTIACAALLAASVSLPFASFAAPNKEDVQAVPKADKAAPMLAQGSHAAGKDPAATNEGGMLKFEKSSYDFGAIQQGESVSTEFPFKNTSDKEVTIKNVGTSCGCTVAELAKKQFKPGEGDVIKVTFNSTGKSGEQTKRITITTDDPTVPNYAVEIHGKVLRDTWFQPMAAYFGDIKEGESAVQNVDYFDLKAGGAKIVELTSTNPNVEAKAGEPIPYTDADSKKEGKKTPITLTVKPGLASGNFNGSIAVKTEGAAMPTNISYSGHVRGSLEAQPQMASFGLLQPGETRESTITLVADAGKEVKILSAKAEDKLAESVTVEMVQANAQGGQPMIKAKITAPEKPGMVRGSVMVEAEVGGKKTSLAVQVWASVRIKPPDAAAPAATQKAEVKPPDAPAGDTTKH